MVRWWVVLFLLGCGPLPAPKVKKIQKTVTPIIVAEETRLSFIREDGSRWARLIDEESSGGDVLDTMPAWSNNGTVAFASSRGGDGLADLSIWIIDSADQTPTRVTDGAGVDLSPAWSRAGGTIAFASSRGDTGYDIWSLSLKVNAEGSVTAGEPVQVTHDQGNALDPAWSPDGKSIVYSLRHGGVSRLRITDAAGNQARDVTVGPNDQSPIFHPGGKLLIYSGMGAAGSDLMVTDLDGTSSETVVEDTTGNESRPVLSHTGRFLFATSSISLVVEVEEGTSVRTQFQSVVFVDLKAPPKQRALRALYGGTVSRSGVALAPVALDEKKLMLAPLYRDALPIIIKKRLGLP